MQLTLCIIFGTGVYGYFSGFFRKFDKSGATDKDLFTSKVFHQIPTSMSWKLDTQSKSTDAEI